MASKTLVFEGVLLLFFFFRLSEYGGVVFGGWARMAQPIVSFTVVEVAKPNIGENWPMRVRADVTINLNVRDNIKDEWEGTYILWNKVLKIVAYQNTL